MSHHGGSTHLRTCWCRAMAQVSIAPPPPPPPGCGWCSCCCPCWPGSCNHRRKQAKKNTISIACQRSGANKKLTRQRRRQYRVNPPKLTSAEPFYFLHVVFRGLQLTRRVHLCVFSHPLPPLYLCDFAHTSTLSGLTEHVKWREDKTTLPSRSLRRLTD